MNKNRNFLNILNSGSFSCSCNAGFSLDEDGATCNDNDECVTGVCGDNSSCQNSPGSYSCQCNPFYFDSAGNQTNPASAETILKTSQSPMCVDINECAYAEPFCGQNSACKNIENGAVCTCHSGFESESGADCVDVDECVVSSNCAGGDEHCVNTIGSFKCECDFGFERDDHGKCVNIDDCLTTQCVDPLQTCQDRGCKHRTTSRKFS